MNKRRINVRAIVWRDGKILAVKHRHDDGSPSDHWATPGGGLDPMELLQDGMKREMKEELGVEVNAGKLLFIQQFHSEREGFDEELEFFFQADDSSMFDAIKLENTTHGSLELAEVAFVDPRKVFIKPEFLSTVDIEEAINNRTPVHIASEL